jgi:channel protein (hemolysin III family)
MPSAAAGSVYGVLKEAEMEQPPQIGAEPLPQMYSLPGFHDPFSAISHLLGAVVFLVLGLRLMYRGRGDRARLIYLGVYAFANVFLFAMSGVYHQMDSAGVARQVMARLDHGAIFVLIAGTFTPAHGILFRGWLRWGPLFFMWAAAITAITLKTIFFQDLPEWFGLSLYLVLGWVGVFSGTLIARRHGFRFVQPLLWGGIAYSIGATFDYLRWFTVIPGVLHFHEIFHLLVLLGAYLHWCFVWQFAAGANETCVGPHTGLQSIGEVGD